MRRFWFVPVIVLVLFVVASPRRAGYSDRSEAERTPVAGQTTMARALPSATEVVLTPLLTPEQSATAAPSPTPDAALTASPAMPTPTDPGSSSEAAPEPAILSAATTLDTPNDLPALEVQNAPPTPAPERQEVTYALQPTRLIIPAIELDLQPVPVGLDERNMPVVPRHDVGWFRGSAMPGQGSNVVFWGHVLRWIDTPQIPAPFARVRELEPGAEIIVITALGDERRYRVAYHVQVRPDDVEYILPTATEQVTLVSCIGDNVIQDGDLTKEFRLITIATPVE